MTQYQHEYKDYVIQAHQGNPRSWHIIYPGKGGRIPVMLEGLFTDRGIAQGAIDLYLEQKDAKAVPKG